MLSAAAGASEAAASAAVSVLSPASERRCSLGVSPSGAGAGAPSAGVVGSRVVTVRGLLRSLAAGARTLASSIGCPAAEDPRKKGLLYAATDTQIWVSFDD